MHKSPTSENQISPFSIGDSDNSQKNAPLSDPWSRKISEYVYSIKAASQALDKEHSLAGHHYRKLEIRWGLPGVILPSFFGPFSLLLMAAETEDTRTGSVNLSDYVSSLGFILTAISTSVFTFFQFGMLSQNHHLYSGKYLDIVTDIDAEMIKKPQFRTSADVFITIIKMKFDHLGAGAPTIPLWIQNTCRAEEKILEV